MSPRDALSAAVAEHRAAIASFVERAAGLPPELWSRPAAPGKWSPEEITEHLRLSFARLELELGGGPAMRRVVPAWKRFLLRRRVLPKILRARKFPRGAPAPREIRPTAPGTSPDEALKNLAAAADRFAHASGAEPGARRRLTHPYFGPLTLVQMHRLLALHAIHHRDQLPPEASPDRVAGAAS